MENASKALLIAGAILIAILLIGLAMMALGNVNGIFDQQKQQADSMTIQSFNSKFTNYEGTNISGSNVKSLINIINTSNASTEDESMKVTFAEGSINKSSEVKANSKYTVEFTPDGSGFYTTVSIKENGTKKQ